MPIGEVFKDVENITIGSPRSLLQAEREQMARKVLECLNNNDASIDLIKTMIWRNLPCSET